MPFQKRRRRRRRHGDYLVAKAARLCFVTVRDTHCILTALEVFHEQNHTSQKLYLQLNTTIDVVFISSCVEAFD